MAQRKSAKATADKDVLEDGSLGFTDEERAAMREHAREVRIARRRSPKDAEANGEADVISAIAVMPEPDRIMAGKVHALIREHAASLVPRTWYGMPAYSKDGDVMCFFQGAYKFKARYATLGFSDKADLDDGKMWPVAYALKELNPSDEKTIVALVKKALG
ncbi:MAG: DUF1801 domain-containing protein [Actinomycetota bacterium]|nr:MAG: DUF1801 domain-containing protein [Actinomycetota bacterium]